MLTYICRWKPTEISTMPSLLWCHARLDSSHWSFAIALSTNRYHTIVDGLTALDAASVNSGHFKCLFVFVVSGTGRFPKFDIRRPLISAMLHDIVETFSSSMNHPNVFHPAATESRVFRCVSFSYSMRQVFSREWRYWQADWDTPNVWSVSGVLYECQAGERETEDRLQTSKAQAEI